MQIMHSYYISSHEVPCEYQMEKLQTFMLIKNNLFNRTGPQIERCTLQVTKSAILKILQLL